MVILSIPPAVLIVAYCDYAGNDVAIVILHLFHVMGISGDALSRILLALLFWTSRLICPCTGFSSHDR